MPVIRRRDILEDSASQVGEFPEGRYVSRQGTVGRQETEQPDEYDWKEDEEGFFPISRLRQQYIDYLSTKVLEYEEQKVARHYYHASQWTPEEVRILRTRRQPIITYNRINRKVDSIVALVQRLRQDPKAFPRNPQAQSGADLVTESIRAVCDGMDFEDLDFRATLQAATEGIGGIELKLVPGDQQDPDVSGDWIFGDDFFYDPRSFKPDFSDARYMGIAKWLDVETAVELFPDKEQQLRTLMVDTGFDLTTHADREFKWVYVNEQRLRLVEHWYKFKTKWYWAFYCSWLGLSRGVSPFLDERNRPMSRFVMFSAAVDHEGDRYGFVRNLKGPQDELNQRRSKALHISNTRRLVMEKGAVDDTERARTEWARPDGLLEVNPGRKVEPDDWQPDLQAQLGLMQDARMEIDTFANITPDLLGADDPQRHSGVAINMLQKAGIAEIGSFIKNYRSWKLRVYRAIWNIVRTTWQNERWLRVNAGNAQAMQLIQLNGVGHDQFGRPSWLNRLGAIDVEIVLDEGPDEANVLNDVKDMFMGMPPGVIPPQVMLEVLPLPQMMRDKLNTMMQQAANKPDPKAQSEQIKAQVAQVKAQSDIQTTQIQAQAEMANAQQDERARIFDAHQQADDHRNIMIQQAQEHQFKMAEIAAKNQQMHTQHAIKTDQLAQQSDLQRQKFQQQKSEQPRKPRRRRGKR